MENPANKELDRLPIISNLINLVFPPTCLFCRIPLLPVELYDFLCVSCLQKAPFFSSPGCPYCAAQPGESQCCSLREKGPFCFAGTAALGGYGGDLKECLHRLKYGGASHLAKPLGELLARCVLQQSNWHPISAITPIPLHPKRLRERGYNQSYLLAQQLARTLNVPLVDVLERYRNTPPQSKLSRSERLVNPKDAFKPKEQKAGFYNLLLKPKNIFPPPPAAANLSKRVFLLVDDIFTTGSTLEAAAGVLFSQGLADRVYNVVVAR